MNYLAHAFLSGKDPDFLLGNITADLLKGNIHKILAEKVSHGVIHHRKIDVFTDNHPDFQSCLPILYPLHGKYASVVLDILFDYFLVQNWDCFSTISLEEFSEATNKILLENIDKLPSSSQTQLRAMIQGNWLLHYGHYEGLSYCFTRLTKRVAQPQWLESWHISLHNEGYLLEKSFLSLFPEMIAFSKKQASLQNVMIW
jgi:acyl carrier protein phosphodiesterase